MFGLESECEEQCDMQQLNSCVDYLVAMARAGNCRETTRIYYYNKPDSIWHIVVMSRPEYRSIFIRPPSGYRHRHRHHVIIRVLLLMELLLSQKQIKEMATHCNLE
jgi:hypothetical protein